MEVYEDVTTAKENLPLWGGWVYGVGDVQLGIRFLDTVLLLCFTNSPRGRLFIYELFLWDGSVHLKSNYHCHCVLIYFILNFRKPPWNE